jgi:hypothetical protein
MAALLGHALHLDVHHGRWMRARVVVVEKSRLKMAGKAGLSVAEAVDYHRVMGLPPGNLSIRRAGGISDDD